MGTTMTASLGSLVTSRRKEIVLLVLVLAAMFTLVSMVGFHPGDPTLLRPGTGAIENPCGPVGANLADLWFATVGLGAWSLIVLVPVAVLGIAGRRVLDLGQWVAGSVLFGITLAGLDLSLRPMEPHAPGGGLGSLIAGGLEAAVGHVGAWLVLASAALLLITVLARIRWSRVVSWFVARVEILAPALGRALWTSARWSGRQCGSLLRWTGAVCWTVVTAVSGQALSRFQGLGQALGHAAGRMWDALARGDGAVSVDAVWDDDEDSSLDSVLSDVDHTDGAGDTVVGHGRELVQAEWEPTVGTAGSGEVLGLFPEFAPRSTSSDPHDGATPVSGVRQAGPTPSAAAAINVHGAFEAAGRAPTAPQGGSTPRPARFSPVPVGPRPEVVSPSAALDPIPSIQPVAPAPASARAPAARAVASPTSPSSSVPAEVSSGVVTGGPGVQVHHNALLDQKVSDDGRALRAQDQFELPALSLLDEVPEQRMGYDTQELQAMAAALEEKLASFSVRGQVTGVRPGPVVTIFEFLPEPGIKVSRIAGLSDDLAMALKALRVRIVAPIPGRGVVGIEIPSKRRMTVYLREALAADEFRKTKAALPCVLGKDVEGRPVVADLAKMPHLLIGGTTGSGKSVGVNGMLMSMLYTRTPDELRMLLVDPKMLEFEMYSDIPHLLHPVVTDAKIAAQALAWACREMDERYALLARWSTRNIKSYNDKVDHELKNWDRRKALKYAPKGWSEGDGELPVPERLPYIVIVVDELADLMMVAGKEVEESICRIAQKARACGIHLIVATQRPSVDVVTGLIKANLPTRIAFQLRTRHDSRTVLDEIGAENLLGQGDMLYMPPGVGGIQRCHGAFVSDEEVGRVTSFLRSQRAPQFIDTLDVGDGDGLDMEFDAEMQDELYDAAVQVVVQSGKASTSMIQRHLKIGYNRAARIIDAMEAAGLIGPADGARPREVLAGAGS